MRRLYDPPRTATPLRVWRVARGFSQRELAELAGVDRRTVIRCERGDQVSLETMLRLSATLGVAVRGLFPPEER